MQPREFLALARKLAVSGDPASSRSAISRAYYAAFHTAAKLQSEAGLPLHHTGKDHWTVARRFEASGDNQLRILGSALQSLRGDRRAADYNLNDIHVGTSANARSKVDFAIALIGGLESVERIGLSQEAIDRMRAWDVQEAARADRGGHW